MEVCPTRLNYPTCTSQSVTNVTTAERFDGGQGRFNSDGVVCVGRVGLTLGIWFDLDARGRSPHVRFEVTSPLLDQGAGGRSPGFLIYRRAGGMPRMGITPQLHTEPICDENHNCEKVLCDESPMPRSYLIFGDIEDKLDVLRVECTKCARKGRYQVAEAEPISDRNVV